MALGKTILAPLHVDGVPAVQNSTFDIARQNLLAAHSRVGATRVARTIQSPYRMVWPLVMRRFGLSTNVSMQTFWGGRFSGVLPEAVSTLVWRFGYFDQYVSLTLLKFLKPGGVFLDIGAHFGFFSLLASHLVGPDGKVVSIEAMPSTFGFLKANIEANKSYDNVTLVEGAAFNQEDELEFSDFGLVASSLNSAFGVRAKNALTRHEPKKVRVKARKADAIVEDLGLRQIDLIKIDAESSEKYVLAGLKDTLIRDKPAVVVEVGDIGIEGGFPSSDIIDFLRPLGYSPFKWLDTNTLAPFEAQGPIEYANLVFVHQSKMK